MSGDNQHFIPLHVLRGFAIAGDSKFGWEYRADVPPEHKRLKKLASDYQFYSEPGPESLDKKITDHENDDLAPNIATLRKNPPGPVDGQLAAEIISHLSMRSESTRESLTSGVRVMTARMFSLFDDESFIRNFVGLSGKEAGPRFKDKIVAELLKEPKIQQSNIPEEIITRVAFGLAREQFSTSHRQFAPALRFKLAALHQSADEIVRRSHNKALDQGVVPEERAKVLAGLIWEVVEVPYNIVLPDCIAVGIGKDGNARPLLLMDNDQLATVAMALSSHRLLIGHQADEAAFDPMVFNIHAIACSERFFVSAVVSPELSDWSRYIGLQSSTVLNQELARSFEEFISAPVISEAAAEAKPQEEEPAPLPPVAYHFLGCADEPTAQRIAAATSGVMQELSAIILLNRLDGVTFAEDYPAALATLDRGFATRTVLTTTDEPNAVGVAMAPVVLRDGIVKAHIVMRGWIGHGLISTDEEANRTATQIFVGQLAEVGCIELFDTAIPGIMLTPFASYFDSFRYTQVADAWSGYFAARVGAPISPEAGERHKTLLVAALKRASEELPRLRLDYRFHGDVRRLLDASMKQVGYILKHSAYLIGHNDGLDDKPQYDMLAEELERLGLKAWFDLYAQDLQTLWDQRGKWGSFEEFIALGYHAERLLWPYGIFVWPTPDGGCGLKVPMHTDAARLPAEIVRRPLQTIRVIARGLWRRFRA